MRSQNRVLPLRWMLPLGHLILCAAILWPIRPMFVGQIRASLREYGILHDSAAKAPLDFKLHTFDLSDAYVQRTIRTSENREWTVAALNLPGALPDFAYAVLSP